MRTLLPLIALASLAAPSIVVAQPAKDVVSVRINTADIDVTTREGRAALEARISDKLRAACTVTAASRYNYGRPVRDDACIANARADALAQAERIALAQQNGRTQVSAN